MVDYKVLLDNKSINVAYDFVRGERSRPGKIQQTRRAVTGKGLY
jgi:hypothetical protein